MRMVVQQSHRALNYRSKHENPKFKEAFPANLACAKKFRSNFLFVPIDAMGAVPMSYGSHCGTGAMVVLPTHGDGGSSSSEWVVALVAWEWWAVAWSNWLNSAPSRFRCRLIRLSCPAGVVVVCVSLWEWDG